MIKAEGLKLTQTAINNPYVIFHKDQWDSIDTQVVKDISTGVMVSISSLGFMHNQIKATKNNNQYNMNLYEKIDRADVLMFDLDGTLVDTNYTNFLSYTKAIQQVMQLNLDLSYSPNERLTREVLKKVIPVLNKNEYERIIKLKNKLYIQYLCETKLNHSVVEILKKYSSTKKIILVTNSHKKRALMTLKYHEIFDEFNHKFCKQKTDSEKKFDKFEYVLTYLQIVPSSVVVFENDNTEIEMAILAGIPADNIINIGEK